MDAGRAPGDRRRSPVQGIACLAAGGGTSTERAQALVSNLADFTLRLSGGAPAGTEPMTAADLPEKLKAALELHVAKFLGRR